MSLDDLITLALIALFIGFPLLQRFMGRGTGQQPPDGTPREDRTVDENDARPDAQRRSQRDQTGAETTGQSTRAQTTEASTEASDGASELERRIAEARRRVQQARQGKSPAAEARPADASTARPRAESRPKPLVEAREAKSTGFLGREGVTRQPRKKAPPMEVSKPKKGKGGRPTEEDVVSLEPNDIMKGIVWHQILSEPVSARKFRRRTSRDR